MISLTCLPCLSLRPVFAAYPVSGWLGRLIGRGSAARPPQRAGAPTAAAPRPAKAENAAFGVRRPLVGAQGNVAGFELLLPPTLEMRLSQRGDAAADAAHQAMLLASAAPLAQSGRWPLLRISALALSRPGVAQQAPSGAMLCVAGLAELPVDLASTLRGRGVRLGLPDGPPASAPQADFVLLQAAAGGLDTLQLAAQLWRDARPRMPLVATGLAHLEDVEQLLRIGFTLAGGALDRSRSAPLSRPLNAGALRICGLLNHLALDHETALVAGAVRADVALSYRLLRYANSPAIGLKRSVESVDDAVKLLGRKELHRWLTVLLMSVAESRQATRALQEAALARGRLLESLALQRQDPAAQTLFSIGLLSLMEVLLQTPLADALAPLRLSEAARQALLLRQGPYAPYLAVAEALDQADGAALDALLPMFGGAEAVDALAADAWSWASEVAHGAVGG